MEVLRPEESAEVRRSKKNLIVPMRWVDTNKSEDKMDAKGQPLPFEAKSRLVVIGFRDKSLGFYRRDAPTASRLAESMLLALAAAMDMEIELGDVRNAYFNGKQLEREVFLEQPRGGLPGLQPGQLLRARKAIYEFTKNHQAFLVGTGRIDGKGRMAAQSSGRRFLHPAKGREVDRDGSYTRRRHAAREKKRVDTR